MLKKLAILVAVLVAALLGYAATRPDSFRVERSITINVPPTVIFPMINDFRRWAAWSPWEHRDPVMKRTYSGAPGGDGAVYEWSGNGDVGSGRMEITESIPYSRLLVDLHFLRPFEARNTAEFTLVDKGGVTSVTWAMYGPSPFVSKVMGLFMSMDRMIGGDFEAGLTSLKATAEKSP